MDILHAYIDESGTNELDASKENVSNLFVCVAILIPESEENSILNKLDSISNSFNNGVEFKSSKIGKRHKRRLDLLSHLDDIPFRYYGLVINKDRIYKDSGLQYKGTYYKFINRKLYEELSKVTYHLKIISDEQGSNKFMESFDAYLKSKGVPTLFSEYELLFQDSKRNRLIQLADIIAGSLTYCFDENKKDEEYSPKFRKILKTKEAGIESWPLIFDKANNVPQGRDSEIDIRKQNLDRVAALTDKYEGSDDKYDGMRASLLKRLQFARIMEDENSQTIAANQLISHLSNEGFGKISRQTFASNIIGRLRDDGVIITGTNEGYRLALTEEDIDGYLEHDKSIIEPMLSRLRKAQNTVKSEHPEKYDILEKPKYRILKKVLDSYTEELLKINTER